MVLQTKKTKIEGNMVVGRSNICSERRPIDRQLVNESTVVSLTREMLNYLVVAMPEHKAQLCDKITAAAERCVCLVVVP